MLLAVLTVAVAVVIVCATTTRPLQLALEIVLLLLRAPMVVAPLPLVRLAHRVPLTVGRVVETEFVPLMNRAAVAQVIVAIVVVILSVNQLRLARPH